VSVPKKARLDVIVRRHRRRTTFCISTGVHRLFAQVDVKPDDRFIGAPGAILNGSRLLTNWTQSGSLWVISGQMQQNIDTGQCDITHPLCNNGNDVFFDGKPLAAVSSLGAVGPGKYFFDYPNDKIYIGSNPAGHKVEGVVARHAFSGCAIACGAGTMISGLTVEKFSLTAIEISDGTVEDNEVRWNHSVGIAVARDGVIRNNYVHDNGLEGLASTGDKPRRNLLVDGNETAHNGWYAGYDMGWEGGGGKWLFVNGLTISNNYSHDNNGIGFWTDTDNINVVYKNNRIENNAAEGIEHEASFRAIIRNNTIRGNGFRLRNHVWVFGAGISIASSASVEIYGNDVEDNYHGIGAVQRELKTGRYGVQEVRNLYVHNNKIKTNGHSGLIETVYDTSYYTSKHNRFRNNTYILSCKQRTPFAWRDPGGGSYYAYITRAQWVAYGNDTTGRFVKRKRCR
jgi:parallel beta-helix repeat protein